MPHSITLNSKRSVAIIGGGLAGIAAASTLVKHGFAVTLHEARNQLGGRAGSYIDAQSDEVLDNCQHVNMGCCTNLKQLCHDLGVADSFASQQALHFISPQGETVRFSESWLPAPFHLTTAFLKLPYITFREKRLFAQGVRALARADAAQLAGQRFADWLREHNQTENLIRCVWEVVLVSALSESLDRIDAAYARKVFVDGFLANREGWRVEIPTASLEELYSIKTRESLEHAGVTIRVQSRLKSLHLAENRVAYAELAHQESLSADEYILAVPQHQVGKLFSTEIGNHATISALNHIETAPISSVHLWLDQQITDLKHAVFVDRFSQWMFQRPATGNVQDAGRFYYQVVISASRNLAEKTQGEIVEAVMKDLASVWSPAKQACVAHSRVITERRAVFSVTPGIDALRPVQQSFLSNLQFAGDWTQTGWPATMEGAVRSGYLAAQNIMRKYDIPAMTLAPDLKQSWLSRCVFGNR